MVNRIKYEKLTQMANDQSISQNLRDNYYRVLNFLDSYYSNKDAMIKEVNKYGLIHLMDNGRVFYSETSPIVYNLKDLEQDEPIF